MRPYVIEITRIEELQTLNDRDELENIFARANSTIINGEKVILARAGKNGKPQPFDELTTEEELANYRKRVFKYVR